MKIKTIITIINIIFGGLLFFYSASLGFMTYQQLTAYKSLSSDLPMILTLLTASIINIVFGALGLFRSKTNFNFWGVIIIVLTIFFLNLGIPFVSPPIRQGGCAMVIVQAENIVTHEIKTFSNPCRIPVGWIIR